MHERPPEIAKLLEEIARYLAAVDLFRASGCEPTWRSECITSTDSLERLLSDRRDDRIVH